MIPMIPRPQRFLDKYFHEQVGITETANHQVPQIKRIGLAITPTIKIDKRMIPKNVRNALGIKIFKETIIWTRDQSRLIEYIASYFIHSNIHKVRLNPKKNPSGIRIHTFYRFSKRIGMAQREFRALRKFRPFWLAVNERKKEILGIERFHEVADAIFRDAINGSHADKRLYLEVFCGHVQTKKIEKKNTLNFEEKIIGASRKQEKSQERPLDFEEQDGSFVLRKRLPASQPVPDGYV